jgi:hydrogenase-4 component B
MKILLLASLGILPVGGLLCLLLSRRSSCSAIGAITSLFSALLGTGPALFVLLGGPAISIRLAPRALFFPVFLKLDALSALFLSVIFLLSALSAIYGTGYLKKYGNDKNIGASWFFYNILVLSMALVCLSGNMLLFLLSWETMALSSFFLVAFESEKTESRKAAWIYLVASQLGTAFLLPLFLILGKASGSLDFGAPGAALSPATAHLCFFLAVIGFGTKAGVMPFHVWLPEAHPAAPSHVSALMSGVMIKTGIYGLVRVLPLLGPPPFLFGAVLIFLGASSGVLGVLFALAQHDLKRLLAYHSVENIGIILLGLGVGFIGLSAGLPGLAALGFAGGLLHVVNHALFKGLLFLGAGAVLKETHTRELDHLGGLLKKMPWTGAFFLVGALAISGLPPFNGFISEFLVYFGSFTGATALSAGHAMGPVLCIGSLALIGGLCAACFTKAFGIVFLGEPRSEEALHARESGALMLIPMAILALLCLLIGLSGPLVLRALVPAVTLLSGNAGAEGLAQASGPLLYVTLSAAGLIVLIALFAGIRILLLHRNRASIATATVPTWDCGYAAPSARMQYTASSFAQPITDLFGRLLRTRKNIRVPAAYFPGKASLETETPDLSREGVFQPVFSGITSLLSRIRVLQEGRLQIYALYIVLTLLLLLIWKLR